MGDQSADDAGAATDSPEATTHTAEIRSAARVSLSRNPLTPARNPEKTYWLGLQAPPFSAS